MTYNFCAQMENLVKEEDAVVASSPPLCATWKRTSFCFLVTSELLNDVSFLGNWIKVVRSFCQAEMKDALWKMSSMTCMYEGPVSIQTD